MLPYPSHPPKRNPSFCAPLSYPRNANSVICDAIFLLPRAIVWNGSRAIRISGGVLHRKTETPSPILPCAAAHLTLPGLPLTSPTC